MPAIYDILRRPVLGIVWPWAIVLMSMAQLDAQTFTGTMQVAAGYGFSVTLKSDGTVWAFGSNASGQLGNGTTTDSGVPMEVSGLSGIESVAAGDGHSLALKSDGTVWAWGANGNGQLGNSGTTFQDAPVQVSGLTGVVAIAAGGSTSLALKSDGTVWAWGAGATGQLGNGGTLDSGTAVEVSGLTGGIAISAGYNHCLAVTGSGSVYAWGDDSCGELGDSGTAISSVPVAVGGPGGVTSVAAGRYHSMALDGTGNVWAWGDNAYGELGNSGTINSGTAAELTGLSGVSAIAAGYYHSMAVESNGTVWIWGSNQFGQLGDGISGNSTAPAQVAGLGGVTGIAGQGVHSLALMGNGTVEAWGMNFNGALGNTTSAGCATAPLYLPGVQGIVEVSGGGHHLVALKSDGSVWTWGSNAHGELGNGTLAVSAVPLQVPGLTGVSRVSAGLHHTLAITGSGSIWAWGANDSGQLGNGSLVDSGTAVVVTGLSGTAVQVSGGQGHSLALRSDGTVWSWGSNGAGQLGNGTTTDSSTPVQVSGSMGIVHQIAAGSVHSVALDAVGNVWAWGDNANGELGNSGTTASDLPVQVSGTGGTGSLGGVTQVAAGDNFSLALRSDGSVVAWGRGGDGEPGDGSTSDSLVPVEVSGSGGVGHLSGVVEIAAGEHHAMALKNDGSLWEWGSDAQGELGSGTATAAQSTPVEVAGLAGVTAMAGGEDFSVAVKEDGSVAQWGSWSLGQLGVNETLYFVPPTPVYGLNLSTDTPPVIGWGSGTSPLVLGQSTTLVATASSGSVSRMEFYQEGVKIGEADSSPWQVNWTANTWGSFNFTGVATDTAGTTSTRLPVATVTVPYDSDSNNLPDWWELAWFGHLGNSAGADGDADGFTNLQEYQNGTNPTDYYNGILPSLTIVSGNNQMGQIGQMLSAPLVVRVTGTSGGLLSNAPLQFSIVGANGQLGLSGTGSLSGFQTVRTGTSGTAAVYMEPTGTVGTDQVEAFVTTNSQTTSVLFTETVAPISVTGLALWLRADSGVTRDGSNNVSGWTDQSGQANNAALTGTAINPVWVDNVVDGKPVVRFSGSQCLTIADSTSLKPSAITVFAVLKESGTSSDQTVLSRAYRFSSTWSAPYQSYDLDGVGVSSTSSPRSLIAVSGSARELNTTRAVDTATAHLMDFKFDGTTQTIYRDGALSGSMAVSGTLDYGGGASAVTIGARSNVSPGEYLNGDIAEMIVYGRALSGTDQVQVRSYLQTKYGVASDSDGDGMPDNYEVANGLNPLVNDRYYDADGDGVPNYWEYLKGTAPNNSASFTPDYIVDPAGSGSNVYSTISAAITAVPVVTGTDANDYKTVYVKKGTYAEKVTIPVNKRIALIGQRSPEPVKLVGASGTDYVVSISGSNVIDGFYITRPVGAIAAGTVTQAGVFSDLGGNFQRIVNCIITGNTGGVYVNFASQGGTIDHCTIFNNRNWAISTYGAVGGSAVVKSSILWDVAASSEVTTSGGTPVTSTSSIVRGGIIGGANTDPLLRANGTLSPGSPAIDADTNPVLSGQDILGDPRPYGSKPDIGAQEWVDTDNDGLPDVWEIEHFGNLTSYSGTDDPDGDGLNNIGEFVAGTDPLNADTDGDGANDGAEVAAGTDPVNSKDTDGDGMSDSYEITNGLNPLANDRYYDKDGDGAPNYWEYLKGTAAGDATSFTPDYIVDPAGSGSNVYSTISAAITAVPVITGTDANDYKTIYVKKGTYAEKVTIPVNKRIALIGQRSPEPVKLVGASGTDYVVSISGSNVIDGFYITRPVGAIAAGTVTQAGVFSDLGGNLQRIVNCIITGNTGGVYVNPASQGGTIDHCTIFNNRNWGVSTYGGGGSAVVKSSILWDVAASSEVTTSGGTPVTSTSSIVRGGIIGGANTDPLLRANGTLSPGSPAIDADTNPVLSGQDILGDTRPYGTKPDIGAQEWIDTDNDGLPDVWEIEHFGNLTSYSGTDDPDGDGLNNIGEFVAGTDPLNADTDGDGANDGAEVAAGTDPVNSKDTDGDGMSDSYEITNGLNPLANDRYYDKDGDGAPNYWEYLKGTAAGDATSFTPDYIVDPAGSGSNVYSTISAAIAAVPVITGTDANDYKAIYVKTGTYAEKVTIPVNKRIALIGQRSPEPVKLVGASGTDYVVSISGSNVIDGFCITRPVAAIAAGTVTQAGVFSDLGGNLQRIVNCIITGNTGGVYVNPASQGGTIDHCTIFNNRNWGVSTYGGGGSAVVKSSILWDVAASSEITTSGGTPVTSTSSIIRGGIIGGANTDPLLRGDGTLSPGSPAIDADTNPVLSGQDIFGDQRPYGSKPDIGAEEWVDTDNDGLPDWWEMKYFGDLSQSGTDDPDGDGLTNKYEYLMGFDPTNPDTLGTGKGDYYEALMSTSNPLYPPEWKVDSDGDGLTDAWEVYYHTDPHNPDTNGDGISDYASVLAGISPTNMDQDGDGISNADELKMGTNPFDADTDHDGVPDNLDWYPTDPTRSAAPTPDPSDTTPPVMTLIAPQGVVLTPSGT